MKYIIGVDQGSTHTRAVVCDLQGNLLGAGYAPGFCHSYDGLEKAIGAVVDAVDEAANNAGISRSEITLLSTGMTGADWPDEYTLLADALRATGICQQVTVHNDAIIAMRGGTQAAYGAILVAGSGANCGGRSPEGEEYLLGYYVEDDLQGGTALGGKTLWAIYRSAVGLEPPTSLTGNVLAFLGYKNVDELRRAQVEGRLPWSKKKDLAPLLFEAASEGDETAKKILREFGEGCAGLVVAVLQHLKMDQMDVEVVLSGSILKGKGPLLVDALATSIHADAPQAHLVQARYEPVVGAALLGLEDCRIRIDEAVRDHIERSALQLKLVRGD